MSSSGDAGDGFTGEAAVVSGSAGLVGVDDVDEVVEDEGTFLEGGLGSADLHLTIDGYGVAADDLAVECFCETDGEGSLSAGGGACDDDEGVVWRW